MGSEGWSEQVKGREEAKGFMYKRLSVPILETTEHSSLQAS